MKDHEIQQIVNDLKDIAVKYGRTQQLRERIASLIVPVLKCEEYRKDLEEPICPICHQEIDPNVCWCGDSYESHKFAEHSFIPMGCNCARAKEGGRMSEPIVEKIAIINFGGGQQELRIDFDNNQHYGITLHKGIKRRDLAARLQTMAEMLLRDAEADKE